MLPIIKRTVSFDVMKTAAIILVIMIHTSAPDMFPSGLNGMPLWYMKVFLEFVPLCFLWLLERYFSLGSIQ